MNESDMELEQTILSLERVRLAHLPTPLEEAPRLAEALGIRSLWIKRDDCTGLAFGGSKVRQLEFLLGHADRKSITTLIAHGSAHSNFIRLTTAAAARLNMRVEILVPDNEQKVMSGNLLLCRILGAHLNFIPGMNASEYVVAARRLSRSLTDSGEKCLVLPQGGASPRGAVGYVLGMLELKKQLRDCDVNADAIVTAVGSGGTIAGLSAAKRLEKLPSTRLIGVCVSEDKSIIARARTLENQVARQLSLPREPSDGIFFTSEFLGAGYGMPTYAGSESMALAASLEGLLLDPVYTSKAFAGLTKLVSDGAIEKSSNIVFWHTGGTTAILNESMHSAIS